MHNTVSIQRLTFVLHLFCFVTCSSEEKRSLHAGNIKLRKMSVSFPCWNVKTCEKLVTILAHVKEEASSSWPNEIIIQDWKKKRCTYIHPLTIGDFSRTWFNFLSNWSHDANEIDVRTTKSVIVLMSEC